ncbi:MAG TPA: hypothetical protein VN763_11390, partial [Saprospiraceae bacterium]|nr:hypothetical protein [Saprospiraceae bacterium]
MKKFVLLFRSGLLLYLFISTGDACAQNKIGLGIPNPVARLHVKGVDNIMQFCIDADTTQSNSNPLIKLRKYDGSD